MLKIDFKKELSHLYGGKVGENVLVDVPKMNFLMVDGKGNPNTVPAFAQAIEVLYPVSYTLKFACKKELNVDYMVMPLEGRFWTDESAGFNAENKDAWQWTLMLMQPEFITEHMVTAAIDTVRKKKGLSTLDTLRFETFAEGRAAQVMYVGPYVAEGPTIAKLHEFIESNGGTFTGKNSDKKHHEIYLSDARRTNPANLKTIIRQPF